MAKMNTASPYTIYVLLFLSVSTGVWAKTVLNSFTSVPSVSSVCTTLSGFITRNVVSCIMACGQSPTCYGTKWTLNKTCSFLYYDCFSTTSLGGAQLITSDKIYKRNIRSCQNNSTWVNATVGCACVNCWVGYYCERYPKNCSELVSFGYPKTSHTCRLDATGDGQAVGVTKCSLFDSGSVFTSIVFSNSTASAHNRSWAAYEGGFRNNSNDFFVGLKPVWALNNYQGLTTVRVQVDFQSNGVAWTWSRESTNFSMQNTSSGYRFTSAKGLLITNSYVPGTINTTYTLNDLLSLSQGAAFSTYDMDQDNFTTKNCASLAGAGWWFNDCSNTVNPLGLAETIRIPGINMQDPEVQSSFKFFTMYFYNKV
ncbi:BgMsFReDn26 [Biomphalaria glabrata]|nr:ficolin-1-like [Biomphalaria glabrata]